MARRMVNASELDLDFKFKVAETREGRTVLGCVQCGTCSSSCPLSEMMEVKPHEVIKMVLLGMRKEALACEKIWACATCYMCAERCPQGVEVGDVLMALANIAARERGIPKGLDNARQLLLEDGTVVRMSGMRRRERERVGLPPTPVPNAAQVGRILREIGIKEIVVEGG